MKIDHILWGRRGRGRMDICNKCKEEIGINVKKCKQCKEEICRKCYFDCELCYKTFCWNCCYMEDQGDDPRCYCEECGDYCSETGIFDPDF